MIIMPRVVTEAQKLKPIGTRVFEVNGQTYAVHRFAAGEGPTLAQAINFAKGKGEMLTEEEVIAIRDRVLNMSFRFKAALQPGDWTYIHNQEKWFQTAGTATCIYFSPSKELDVGMGYWNDLASQLLILNVNGYKVAAPKKTPNGVVLSHSVYKEILREVAMLRDMEHIDKASIPALLKTFRE